MKKVIALHASRRKMNTYGLLVQIQQKLAQNDVEMEILSLYDYNIQDCLGCEKCILQGDCVRHDDVEFLMNKLEEADGIILSSPVYLQQVSGKLKSFIDRTCKWYHRPVLYGKPVLCVATTKGSGLKSTLSYLGSVAVQWGAMPIGRIGRTIRSIESPVTDKELSGFIKLLQAPQSYRPTLNSLINFETQKALAKYLNGLDTCYWSERGWDTKPYYFRCGSNGLACILSKAFGVLLRRGMAHGQNKTGRK
ncbi:MAG: flavodoxin family protein [Oscillospiraceae bacterium]|nr:flavodoxin family protein [Oscillospiraceae bacterium]HNX99213.1 flavodoxin family protein [Oscillospiraceae bacterium]